METTNNNAQKPESVIAVAEATMVLVTYVTKEGTQITQPALVGKNNALMLDGRDFGLGNTPTPKGPASKWLFEGIKAKQKAAGK